MAKWSTAYKDTLPDSSFLLVLPGGKKDKDGKTVPRSKRKFPVRDKDGKIDKGHLDDALSRIESSNLSKETKAKLEAKAEKLLAEWNKERGMAKSLGSMSYNDLRQELQEYLQQTYGKKSPNGDWYSDYPWIVDVYEDEFVCEKGGKYYIADYEVQDDGTIKVGDFYAAKKIYSNTGKKANPTTKSTGVKLEASRG